MSLKMWFIPFVFIFFTLSGCGGDDHPYKLTELQITASENPIPLGFQSRLTATAFYSDGYSNNTSATWESLDDTTATVDETGLVTSLTSGEVTIQATTAEGTGTFLLTITPAILNAIQLSPVSTQVPLGVNINYEAIGSFSDGSSHNINTHPDLVWHSTRENVAVINKETARSNTLTKGSTIFTAVLGISSNEVQLEVTPRVIQSIKITPERVTWPKGLTQQFEAQALLSDGSTINISNDVKWSSSNPSTLEFVENTEQKGVFKGINIGSSSVSATYISDNYSDDISSDNQALFIVEKMDMLDFTVISNDYQPLGQEVQFEAMAEFTDGNSYNVSGYKQVHWQSSDPLIATVTLSGLVKGVKKGNVTITASTAYDDASAHKEIEITKAVIESIVVLPVDGNIILTEGKTQQFEALARYTDGKVDQGIEMQDEFYWSVDALLESVNFLIDPSDYPIPSINDQGLMTYDKIGVSPGIAYITADFMGFTGTETLALPNAELIGVPNSNPMQEFIGVLTSAQASMLTVDYSSTHYDGDNNHIEYVTMSYNEALVYCEQLLYNGKDDWHLPNSDELVALWQSEDAQQTTFSAGWVFKERYWSTTTHDNGHLIVALHSGDLTEGQNEDLYYASCMRSAQ